MTLEGCPSSDRCTTSSRQARIIPLSVRDGLPLLPKVVVSRTFRNLYFFPYPPFREALALRQLYILLSRDTASIKSYPVADSSGAIMSEQFTLAEVEKHNTKKDLYMVIHDKVYNTSAFVDEHP